MKGKIIMTNPFEDKNGTYVVILNDEGQYSLWPTFIEVPFGWKVVYGEDSRQFCLDYINSEWKDMQPNSLKLVTSAGKGN